MVLRVRRYSPGAPRARYDHFNVKVKPGMTVLTALFYVQDRLDDSLAFRYSCRGAVCGACAMLINKTPRLACRTQLTALVARSHEIALGGNPSSEYPESWKPKDEVIIEPLPHLPVIQDLVVDMSKFFAFYRTISPGFRPPAGLTERESRLDPSLVIELEKYTNCILCAACYGACPIPNKNPNYLGPAALAKLYRCAVDPRENQEQNRLASANQPDGWWSCDSYGNCRKVCPKGVPLDSAIGRARQRLKELGLAPEASEVQEPRTKNQELQEVAETSETQEPRTKN
jgi:succinate dehydrogenase / fumarate reductase iron-sulfur subunit